MSTQQDIYAVGSENRPHMLNKENYVPWSSRLLRYAKSRPNGKFNLYNSIMNGPYVRRMITEPGDADREVPVNLTYHEQTDDKLSGKELKQIEADDQAIQTILLSLPEDIYAVVYDIGIQEKKAKLFDEWERFTSIDGESIGSLLSSFLKYNQKEVDKLRAERLAKTQDPLALMANSNNPFNYPVFHPDLPSSRNHVVQNAVQNPGVQNVENQNGVIVVPGIANQNGNGNVVVAQAEGNANRNNEAGIQLQAEEFNLMAAAADLDEIEEVNANCILMANLQQASTSGTQTDKLQSMTQTDQLRGAVY
ncbi:hypothetical protein Tco_1259551 [Tanacetum coccineum]